METSIKKASASEKGDWKEEVEQVNYVRHNPTLHMFKKPSWAKGRSALDIIEPVEYKSMCNSSTIWKSAFSIPMLFLLALPILIVFAVTSLHYGAFSDSLAPQMFKATRTNPQSPVFLAGFWALSLISFVPWSATVCRLEGWVSKYLE
ncbi:MAG: hypothetical protein V1909_02725 [Candidatus Micrarchaeota archaeon]